MTDTANLGLPCIEGSQAQKHVTHNEALRILDTLVQLAVDDRDLTAPPGSPTEGQRYIVKAGATGAWAGRDDDIAAWQDGAWQFSAPRTGWLAYVIDESLLLAWNGSSWQPAVSIVGTAFQNLNLLGVGTTADSGNPVSAKLNNALFTAKTVAEGGDGHLRYKLSKESAAKTASLLFQDNYSGRAEFGLTGDDNFHVKVSADGATWYEAIVIDRSNGRVSLPLTGLREILTANRTYYVRTDGNDANSGLVNNAGGAFLTLQKAVDTAAALDCGIYGVTIAMAAGTYGAGAVLKSHNSSTAIAITGDAATPSNVSISVASPHSGGVIVANGILGPWSLRGIKVATTTSGFGIYVNNNSVVGISDIEWGTVASGYAHCAVTNSGMLTVTNGSGNYRISGGATSHWLVYYGATLVANGVAFTLTGSPNFASSFASIGDMAKLVVAGSTFSGAASGVRYSAAALSLIDTGGGGANYLPGSSAGSATGGSQYL